MSRLVSRSSLLAVAAATAMSTGCAALGSNYERPQIPTPSQYRFVEASDQAASIADLPWFQVFDDPALQALIREALSNNLDLRTAAARVQEFRARAGIAASYLYPQVDAGVGYTARVATNAPSTDSTNEDTVHQSGNYGFRLSWEIDLFGRIRRERESAVAAMMATEQARRGVIVTLVGDIASTYFSLRELDLRLDIAHRTLGVNDETVTYFQNRLDGGVSNQLEVDRVRALRAKTAATIPELERQIAVAENALSLLVGRPPSAVGRTTTELVPPTPPVVPAGVPATLLERRPDVMEAEQLLVAANADIGAAKALFYPTISLTGFLGGVSGDLTTFLGGDGGVWSVGAGLLQPVFQGGRLRRNLEATQARYDQAIAQYQKAALNGYREVADSLVTIQKLAAARIERQIGVTVLQDAGELSRVRYDSGLANYIEILTADEQLFEQQQLVAQTIGDEMRARAELYRALGGGWQQPQQQQP